MRLPYIRYLYKTSKSSKTSLRSSSINTAIVSLGSWRKAPQDFRERRSREGIELYPLFSRLRRINITGKQYSTLTRIPWPPRIPPAMQASSCVLTILVDMVVIITELERLLKDPLMSIYRIKWYNDVIFVVSDGCIVGWKNWSVLVELAKPFLINTIHKGTRHQKVYTGLW